MDFGFGLFKINYEGSPELTEVEGEIKSLEEVWKIK